MSSAGVDFDIDEAVERWQAARMVEYLLGYVNGKVDESYARSPFFESLLRRGKALQNSGGPRQYLATALRKISGLKSKAGRRAALTSTQNVQRNLEAQVARNATKEDATAFQIFISNFPAHEVVSRSSLSAQRLTTVQLGPKSVMELPTPAILTAEELDCLFELHEMAKKKCIVAFIYLHGMIKMGVPHVQAPEGVCVTMIRASPTGCQALGGTPEEVALLEESIAAGLPSSLLFRKADAALRARETRHVSDFLYKIQEHLLFEIEYPPEKQSAINNYIRALHTRIEPEHHCSAVECVPDQLFFNKMYGRDHLKHHKLDAIRIIHMKSSVDLFSVMLKCGFGSLDAKRGLDIIYRDQVFSFFKAMGVTMLTIIDHSCSSVVLPDTHDDPSAAEIRDFLKTNKGVLGGNSCRKTHSPAV